MTAVLGKDSSMRADTVNFQYDKTTRTFVVENRGPQGNPRPPSGSGSLSQAQSLRSSSSGQAVPRVYSGFLWGCETQRQVLVEQAALARPTRGALGCHV